MSEGQLPAGPREGVQAAYEHNGVLVSAPQFYAIACDPRRSVAVEACAGAGKTWMLVSRMVRALLDGCAPHEILAITFTKKAAGEMRQRLQEWLQDFAHASDEQLRTELRIRGVGDAITPQQLAQLRGLHAQLLQGGRPVQIRTFHGWFAALLGSAPLAVLHSLGLPTAYELLQDDSRAIAQVWRRFQSRVAQDLQARADYAQAVATYGRHQAHKALESALHKRTEFALADANGVVAASVAHFTVQFPDFDALQEPQDLVWTAKVHAELQEAASILGRQSGSKCVDAAHGLERGLTQRDFAALWDALFTKSGSPRKLGDKFDGAAQVQEVQQLLLQVRAAQVQHQAWLHQQRMTRLARMLLEEYAALKRERGWIDMGDLERAALALMSDEVLSGWVQERLDARIRHLLIDEFQDTNPLQWQALYAWLSGYTGAGSSMGVFIVGDPKQSIYRFRRAEPQVFRAAQAFVRTGLHGDVLSCDHTRRNAPEVLNLVNAVMLDAQAQSELDGFRPHSTASEQSGQVWRLPRVLRAAAQDAQSDLLQWRDSLTTPRYEEEENQKALECRQAARWLARHLRQTGLRAQDVMVLSRKRERLRLMQEELAAVHLSAQQPEKNDLMDLPEVQDLVALLDVLVSPQHDLSLARVLKSPLFGLDDAALVEIATRKRALISSASWWQLLQEPRGWPESLQAAAQRLAAWRVLVQTLPPHDALSAIYDQGEVLSRYAIAAPAGTAQAVVAHLQGLLHAAMAVEGGRYLTSYTLVRALRAGGVAAPVRADQNAIQLLTVHGAKGLEAPLVLLLDTDGEAPAAQTMGVLVDWPGEAAYPRRFVFLASESHPPACVADALAVELAARQREEVNGLYVALTRARQTLVISSMEPFRSRGNTWWQRLQGHATPLEVDDGTSDAPKDVSPTAEEGAVTSALPDITLQVLPPLQRKVAAPPVEAPSFKAGAAGDTPDSLTSRLGQAMHRLLEWLPLRAGGYGAVAAADLWTAAQRQGIGREFTLDAAHCQRAEDAALGIVRGTAAWAWDAEQIAWQGNEVAIVVDGRMLRIDRLVQTLGDGQWWVLDYKLSPRPQDDPVLHQQLHTYRQAVSQACAAHSVRAAFLTPQGATLEIERTSP